MVRFGRENGFYPVTQSMMIEDMSLSAQGPARRQRFSRVFIDCNPKRNPWAKENYLVISYLILERIPLCKTKTWKPRRRREESVRKGEVLAFMCRSFSLSMFLRFLHGMFP